MRRFAQPLAFVLLWAAGCTFEPGSGFATITGAEVAAFFEPGAARDLGEGVLLTDLGYHIEVSELTLGVDAISLEELRTSGGGGGVFDPAEPPPGYSLCHGGHCHADDGSLVGYEEIQAELSGGGASYASLAVLPVGADLDMLDGDSLELDEVFPSRELPRATIARVALSLETLRVRAVVTGGSGPHDLGEREVSFDVDLEIASQVTVATNRTVDRDASETIDLHVDLVTDGTLFDQLDMLTLAGEEDSLVLTEIDSPASLALAGALLESGLVVSF